MGALEGVKVLELGQVVAAPFCGVLLADFGADVIKVEMPGAGDNLRAMGPIVEERSLWYMVENRNKRSITLDLKSPRGKELLTELIQKSDVVLENFKPGTIEKLGFGWDKIHEINPRAVFVQISGYGQTGPYSQRYGYDRIGLAMGGLTYISGFPDRPPVRPGVSLADYLAGYSAAIGVMMALYHRDIGGSGTGQKLDISLYDTVFRISEFTALNYQLTGTVRQRIGNAFPATVPSGHFKTKDGKWVSIAVGNNRLFERFCRCVGREDLLERPEYATTTQRSASREEIDQACADWVAGHTAEECFRVMADEIPIGPVNSIADIMTDPQYEARHNLATVHDSQFGDLKVQNVCPDMSGTPGEIRWFGPALGEHNQEVYQNVLGLSEQEIDQLRTEKII